MLDDVIFALYEVEAFPGASMFDIQGIGSGGLRGHLEQADRRPLQAFPKYTRIEIVCPDNQVEDLMETIQKKAHTGMPHDGKIYVSPVDEALRIRTGERGNDAV
jgi:nitrogen regulatory protein P-II 1